MAVPVRLVLDTNVWLDWLVFDDPQITPLRAAQGAGEVVIFIDAACAEELRRVLDYSLRKQVLAPEAQARALAECLRVAQPVAAGAADGAALPPLPLCRDADDQKFLELARAARADYLLTKDRALLDLARRKYAHVGFRIMTPAAYQAQGEVKA
ncbi:MAG TPA: putative toxin-antitoxin system toxin component, PIN family [Burkholderiales bacterium]|nr:putative toxin-antitoxin system toxin component, PIN family [Burkholderiales bacterium]